MKKLPTARFAIIAKASFKMQEALCLVVFLFSTFFVVSAQGAIHSLAAIDQGWYNNSGSHNPSNNNTLTGGIGVGEYRSWYKFSIPAECADGVQSAQYTLTSVFGSRGGGGTSHSMSLNAVSPGNVTSVGISTSSTAIFNDLGDGTLSTFNVVGNGDFTQSVILPASALSDLEAAGASATKQYALGLRHLSIVGTQYVMGYSQPTVVTASLKLDCSLSATIRLTKTVENNYGGTATISDFTPLINGTPASWASSSNFAPGAYVVSESALSGYSSSDWTGDCEADGSLNLVSGQQAVCAIVNKDIPATLTLTKRINNSLGGTAVDSDFTPSIDGTATTWGVSVLLESGAHVVTESSLIGYTAGNWEGDCNPDGSISLVLAQDAACEIENRSLGVDLQIDKSVNNQNPNIGELITFTLVVKNAGPDAATNTKITDELPLGFTYQLGSIAGGDARDDSDPTGIGLNWEIASLPDGSSATLSFSAIVVSP